MAPPEQTFPISELERRILATTKNFKGKSRKLPRDFDLKRDCELFELVQYSCSTVNQIYEKKKNNPLAPATVECFPFVRLFRRYDDLPSDNMICADSDLGVGKETRCSISRLQLGKESTHGSHQQQLQRTKCSTLRAVKRRTKLHSPYMAATSDLTNEDGVSFPDITTTPSLFSRLSCHSSITSGHAPELWRRS